MIEKLEMACADPESFVREGPALTSLFFIFIFLNFFSDEGRKDQIPLLAAINGLPAKRHLNGISLAGR